MGLRTHHRPGILVAYRYAFRQRCWNCVSDRCAFAHLPGLPCHPRHDQPVRTADQRPVRLRARSAVPARACSPTICLRLRPLRADVSQHDLRGLQGPPRRRCPTICLADSAHPSTCWKRWPFRSSAIPTSRPTTCWPRSAKPASARGYDVFLCTSDKDCRQLIDERVRLYNLRKRQEFGREELKDDWGVKPEQVVDLQTLVGDSVDNVPGVPGIGVKTAAKLLQDFGTLENLLANIDKVSGKKRQENLRRRRHRSTEPAAGAPGHRCADRVRLGRLASARTGCGAAGRTVPTWGFRTFEAEFRQAKRAGSRAEPDLFAGRATNRAKIVPFGANAPADGHDAERSLRATPRRTNWQAEYHLVDTRGRNSRRFISELHQQKRIAIDLETTSLSPLQGGDRRHRVLLEARRGVVSARCAAPRDRPLLDPKQTLDALRPILEDPDVAKVNQNIKYDLLVLRASGIELARRGRRFDGGRLSLARRRTQP